MPHLGKSKLVIFLAVSILASLGNVTFPVHAAESYLLSAFPFYSQEGSTIIVVLAVRNANPFFTKYSFEFYVRDPSTTWWTSLRQNYTTAGETEFSIILNFPSPEFPCGASCPATSLVGTYVIAVSQLLPSFRANPAPPYGVFVGILDRYQPYQRTQTVSIMATRYLPGESVSIAIRTSISLTLVYSHTVIASLGGQVTDSWYIPKDATVTEDYVVTLTGTNTSKSPADAQGFTVQAAFINISGLSSSKSTYQRTETMSFSFQATYPSGEIANTGLALITLTRPDRTNRTLTASYNSTNQNFVATYKTTATNQTGTWTGSLADYGFDDGFGNIGPDSTLAISPDLLKAALTPSIAMKTTFARSEQIKINATVPYPDGTLLTSALGTVSYVLSLIGGGYTASAPLVFDNSLNLWIGIYSPRGDEPSGLWSLNVTASDSATPINSGFAVKAIQIQNSPPLATFTGSTNSALTGVSITFDASSSSDPDGTIVRYFWNFGDGSTGSGATTTHSYATPGTYTVTLTVEDNLAATHSPSGYTVTVTAAPQSGDIVSLPLFYFAILAGALAAAIGGAVFALRRHKVTHARLKIDLDAVRTEAGRIENQEFFQSVKDQLKKDKDD
ncbi:MAG TPA: PKD domain-containing protein [Candidatus Bathyarchaeia archaeon]|nr:PKD domain-containing protein [Candidatus Bathyarchaeia archaeon]